MTIAAAAWRGQPRPVQRSHRQPVQRRRL